MTSIQTNLPLQYRARAKAAREQATTAATEEQRQRLLHDAEQWERMADYEEKTDRR